MSVARRLKRSLDHIRLHTGAAPLTVLNPRAPRISMLNCPAVGRRFEPSPEAAAMFGEFWFSKLDTMEFCGTQIQQMPYNTGLRHLLLTVRNAGNIPARSLGFFIKDSVEVVELPELEPDFAEAELGRLLELFRDGLSRPLPLAAYLSLIHISEPTRH